jgi:hypothetical protein
MITVEVSKHGVLESIHSSVGGSYEQLKDDVKGVVGIQDTQTLGFKPNFILNQSQLLSKA